MRTIELNIHKMGGSENHETVTEKIQSLFNIQQTSQIIVAGNNNNKAMQILNSWFHALLALRVDQQG